MTKHTTAPPPRIDPLEPPWPDAVDAVLARMTPPGVEPLALFRTFARNLPMSEAMVGWGRYELGRTLSVGAREREIVIDRVCARCGCEYEWGVHVAAFAARVGLSDDQVTATAAGAGDDPAWSATDALLIRLVDELHDTATVSDDLWAALAAVWRPEQLLDLLVLAGWYHAVSYVANAARVPPEPWAVSRPGPGRGGATGTTPGGPSPTG